MTKVIPPGRKQLDITDLIDCVCKEEEINASYSDAIIRATLNIIRRNAKNRRSESTSCVDPTAMLTDSDILELHIAEALDCLFILSKLGFDLKTALGYADQRTEAFLPNIISSSKR